MKLRLAMTFAISIVFFIITKIRSEVHYRRLLYNPDEGFDCLILEEDVVKKFKGFTSNNENELKIRTRRTVQAPADVMLEILDKSQIMEIWAKKESVVESHVMKLCKTYRYLLPSNTAINQSIAEIVKIVDGGDQTNRIDVVFMGDGYTVDERVTFFEDIRRLTQDMFQSSTFRSYLPVFNIWAIHVPSVESGIGQNGPQNTAFGLHRTIGQLRAIYPGNTQYAREVCQLTGTGGCDYPSLIGNDEFYGGLGGEFVISTKSNRTGTTVLRHEMGHSFINAGEEYDNGLVYRGVNTAQSLSTLGWNHWLSNVSKPTEERIIYRLLEYPWYDLSQGDQSFTFTSDGAYNRWYLLVSVSAAGEEGSLEFILDGKILPWTSHGFDDREFYDWSGTQGFVAGHHTFMVRSKTPSTNPHIPRMICSVTLHEMGNEDEFHMDNTFISAYPTWDVNRHKTFRPTNAGCLMRNMTAQEFCLVCREGMWYKFLERISLIDSVDVADEINLDGTRTVILRTLKLGQLRKPENIVKGERLIVRWYLGGVEQMKFRDQFEIHAISGSWSVQVDFSTPEVRSDPLGLLSEEEAFTILE